MLHFISRWLPASRDGSPVRFPFLSTWVLLTIAWAAVFWPALHHAWLFFDDYSLAVWGEKERWNSSLGLGRPVLALWSYTFCLDGLSGTSVANVLLRLAQGALHTLTGTVVAYLLWKETRVRLAALAVLPFVLWPFNTEAVLWRGAGINVLAALFSVLGVALIRAEGARPRLAGTLGVGLLALGMLTTQASAAAGLVVWAMLLVLSASAEGPPRLKPLLREGGLLLLGYLVGGIATVLCSKLSATPNPRGVFATDWAAKAAYLIQLNNLYLFFPAFYPRTLKAAHLLLVGASAVLLVGAGASASRRGPEMRWWSLAALAPLAACAVLPYISVMVVQECWPAWRNMYLAPLLATALFAVGFRHGLRRPIRAAFYGVLLLVVLWPYARLGRENAAEYVRTERGDRQQLRQLEQFAEQASVRKVVVLMPPDAPLQDWNPYRLRFMHCDSHISALACTWTVRAFINRHSTLEVTDDPHIREEALKQLRAAPCGRFFTVDGCNAVALCPP